MTNQTSFEVDTRLGAGKKRSIEGNYPGSHPRITPDSTSKCTKIVDGHNKATGVRAWVLTFASYTETGRPVDVTFAHDDTVLTMFLEAQSVTVPGSLKGLAVNWTVIWRKVGYINVCREITLREDTPVNTAPAATNELTEAFPRTADNQPAAKHWIDGKENQAQYWGAVGNWARWIGIIAKDDQHTWSHKVIGVDKSTREFGGPLGAALEEIARAALRQRVQQVLDRAMTLQDFIDAIGYKTVEMAWKEGQLSDNDIRKLMDDYLASDKHKGNEPPAPEAPASPEPALKDEKSIPLPQNVPMPLLEAKNGIPASGMSEAGFSMNFFWCDTDGAETQFTMREATWQAGLENVEKFKAGLRKLGYMPKAEYARQHGAPAVQTAAPAESGSGAATCMMIRVAQAFSNGKLQLEFECNGFEKPLRYTNAQPGPLAQLLRDVRKLDGTPFTAADIAVGQKFVGNWIIDWQKQERDGKTYQNVMRVRAA